ncbi:MAG: VTT domain-containing protein, partial [candidate division WOR-3 bacterium]
MSPQTQHGEQQRLRRVVSVTVLVVLAAVLAVAFTAAGRHLWHYFRSPAELRELVQRWGIWAPLGTVLFQMLQIVVAPLPGSVMSFACGYALGLWPTIVWLMLGVALGATLDFLLARLLGRRLLHYLVPPDKLARLDEVVIRRGTFYVFLLLLVPNPLGDWIYYLAGLTPIP